MLLRGLEVERNPARGDGDGALRLADGDRRELGFRVTVLAGTCACVDARLEAIALEYLREIVGAYVVS